MAKTAIEWTDQTWNPIAGCSDVSEGCRNCYARGMARRLVAMGSAKYAGLTVMRGSHVVWTGKINFDEKAMLVPLRRKTPTRYFVNSMSDLFHENVLRSWLVDVWAVMVIVGILNRLGVELPTVAEDEVRSWGGHIVGKVDIIDCVSKSDSPWFFGEYGFVLANAVAFEKPVPCKGALGFFTVPDDVLAQLESVE